MKQILAHKRATSQMWTQSGLRIPVTVLNTSGNVVLSSENDFTMMAFGTKKIKHTSKPMQGTLKKIGIEGGIRLMKKLSGSKAEAKAGDKVKPSDVIAVGDMVKVTGISKGMGFAGGMKRHGFHGGPKTHGQSDRWRSPGSSASGTTLGRLFPNKRMPGRGGNKTVTVLNLQVVGLDDVTGEVLVKGVIPGAMNSVVTITKISEGKFEGIFTAPVEVVEEVAAEVAPESAPAAEVVPEVAAPVETAKEVKVEAKEVAPTEAKETAKEEAK